MPLRSAFHITSNAPGERPTTTHHALKEKNPAHSRRLGVRSVDKSGRVRLVCLTLKTATVRDLGNRFPHIAAWIE